MCVCDLCVCACVQGVPQSKFIKINPACLIGKVAVKRDLTHYYVIKTSNVWLIKSSVCDR